MKIILINSCAHLIWLIKLLMNEDNGLIILKNRPRDIQKERRIKIDVSKTQYQLIRNVAINQVGWTLWGRKNQKGDANIFWTDTYISQELVKRLRPYQRVNHFPNSQELGKKNLLSQNLKKMKSLYPQQYNFFPETWTIPQQYESFQSHQKQLQQIEKIKKWYIVKPSASSQGKGIYLTKRFEADFKQPTVVQNYIMNPLLIQGCKFDLRVYVLIKSLHPLKIFRYEEGLMRLSTSAYEHPSKSNKTDLNMHLTNYAINKFSPTFIQNKNIEQDFVGHKRSLSSVFKYLSKIGCETQLLQQQIDEIIVKTIISAYPKLLESYRDCRQFEQQSQSVCFQILGFDILIDDKFKAWLIQVNHSPSFCTESPLDFLIKKFLILDSLVILNLNADDKQAFLRYKSKEMDNFKDKDMIRIKRKSQEQFQKSHLGGYVKIYPNPSIEAYSIILDKVKNKKSRCLPLKKLEHKNQKEQFTLPPSSNSPNLSARKRNAITIYGRFKQRQAGAQDLYSFGDEYGQQLKELFLEKEKKKIIQPVKLTNINISFFQEGKNKYNNVLISRKRTGNEKSNIKKHNPTNSLVLQSKTADGDRNDIKKLDYQLKVRISKMKLARIKLHKTQAKSRQSQFYSQRVMMNSFRSEIRGEIKYVQPFFCSKPKD